MANRFLDRYGLEHYHDLIQAGLIEYIEGTQTSATSAWTGVSTSPALFAGKLIIYHLPYNTSSATATLNLTHPDGTSVGAKQVQTEEGASPKPPAGTDILLVYDGSKWKTVAATPISDLAANRAMVSSSNGKASASAVTATELGYLSGVTSGVQSQLDSKVPNALEEGTAADLGVGTVPDALDVIFSESKFMVGDIVRTTKETDDGWIFADGSVIEEEEYPALYKMLAYSGYVSTGRTITASTSSAKSGLKFFKKLNGYYVGMAYGTLFYRPVSGTTWTTRNLASTIVGSYYKLGYADMMWDEDNEIYILFCNVTSESGSGYGRSILYTLSSLDGSLTQIFNESNTSSGETDVRISKEGDYYVANDHAYDNVSAANYRTDIRIATDPTGTWTSIRTASATNPVITNLPVQYPDSIKYINGRYFVGGYHNISSDDGYYPALAYTDEGDDLLSATWTRVDVGDIRSTVTYPGAHAYRVTNIVYMENCGAYLVAIGEQGANENGNAYYSYDLQTFTQLSVKIGVDVDYQKEIDGVLYVTTGAFRDSEMTSDSGVSPFLFNLTGTLINPKYMTEDGVYMTIDSATVTENSCVRSIPDLGVDNGMLYKIKAEGVPGTEGDEQ